MPTNDDGNTPLHNLLLNCTDLGRIVYFLNTIDPKSAIEMAKTINNVGQLPADLVNEMRLSQEHKSHVKKILFSLLNTPEKKFTDLVNTEEVLARYNLSPDSELYKNLKLACHVVNESRRAINKSFTHPEINNWGDKEKLKLGEQSLKMRSAQDRVHYTIMLTHFLGLLFNTSNTVTKKFAEYPLQHKIGACDELALVAIYFLRKKDNKLPLRQCTIKNGDHKFIILGEKKHAVVCDPWAGDVYPEDEISKRMKDYRHVLFLNVFTSYNPKYHSIITVPPNHEIYAYFKLAVLIAAMSIVVVSFKVINSYLTEDSDSSCQLVL